MPWELTIVNSDDVCQPLGNRDDVIAQFAAALPGVLLQPPPGPSPEILAQMPPMLRDNLLRPKLCADFEGDDLSIQFYANDRQLLDSVGVEVGGNGNPIPALAALCLPNSWAAIDASNGARVDLSATDSPAWEKFRAWRDKAVRSLPADGNVSK